MPLRTAVPVPVGSGPASAELGRPLVDQILDRYQALFAGDIRRVGSVLSRSENVQALRTAASRLPKSSIGVLSGALRRPIRSGLDLYHPRNRL